jgi:hypothetical protein
LASDLGDAVKHRWLLNLLLVLGLCRYVWLAAYMHPYADDLTYAYTAYQQPLAERLVNEYHHWNGRLASNILVLRGPLVWGQAQAFALYRCVPVILILGMVGAWLVLLRTAELTFLPRDLTFTAALLLTTLWLHTLPDLTEGLYWYTGALTYTLPHLLLLLLIAAALRLQHAATAVSRVGWYVCIALLGIWVIWSNEVHLVLLVLAAPLLLKVARRTTDHRITGAVLVLLIMFGAAVCSVLAPGNAARAGLFEGGGQLLHTAGWTVLQTGRFVVTWSLSPGLLLATVLGVVWLRGQKPEHIPLVPFRWYFVAAAMLGVVVVCVALPYWATGMLGQHRTVNVAWSLYLPLWCIFIVALEQQVLQPQGVVVPYSGPVRRWLTVALVLALVAGGNDGRVAHDLLTGAAAQNDRAWNERYTTIRSAAKAGMSELQLSPLSQRTAALHIMELNTDPEHWTNKALVHYLGAHPVRVGLEPRAAIAPK